jgi:hypothetical protein
MIMDHGIILAHVITGKQCEKKNKPNLTKSMSKFTKLSLRGL